MNECEILARNKRGERMNKTMCPNTELNLYPGTEVINNLKR